MIDNDIKLHYEEKDWPTMQMIVELRKLRVEMKGLRYDLNAPIDFELTEEQAERLTLDLAEQSGEAN